MQAVRLEPRPLGASAVQELLQEWSDENAVISLLPSIAAFAEHVFSLTAGHAGLTGMCLAQLTSWAERHGQLSLAEWSHFAVVRLPMIVRYMDRYCTMISDVDQLDNTALKLLHEVGFRPPRDCQTSCIHLCCNELEASGADDPS